MRVYIVCDGDHEEVSKLIKEFGGICDSSIFKHTDLVLENSAKPENNVKQQEQEQDDYNITVVYDKMKKYFNERSDYNTIFNIHSTDLKMINFIYKSMRNNNKDRISICKDFFSDDNKYDDYHRGCYNVIVTLQDSSYTKPEVVVLRCDGIDRETANLIKDSINVYDQKDFDIRISIFNNYPCSVESKKPKDANSDKYNIIFLEEATNYAITLHNLDRGLASYLYYQAIMLNEKYNLIGGENYGHYTDEPYCTNKYYIYYNKELIFSIYLNDKQYYRLINALCPDNNKGWLISIFSSTPYSVESKKPENDNSEKCNMIFLEEVMRNTITLYNLDRKLASYLYHESVMANMKYILLRDEKYNDYTGKAIRTNKCCVYYNNEPMFNIYLTVKQFYQLDEVLNMEVNKGWKLVYEEVI